MLFVVPPRRVKDKTMRRLLLLSVFCLGWSVAAEAEEVVARKGHPNTSNIGLQGKHVGAPIFFRKMKIKLLG